MFSCFCFLFCVFVFCFAFLFFFRLLFFLSFHFVLLFSACDACDQRGSVCDTQKACVFGEQKACVWGATNRLCLYIVQTFLEIHKIYRKLLKYGNKLAAVKPWTWLPPGKPGSCGLSPSFHHLPWSHTPSILSPVAIFIFRSAKKKLTQEWGSSFDQEPGSAEESLLSSPSSFSAICSKSPPQSHATTSAQSFPLPPHQPLLPTPSQRIPPASAPSSLRALHDVRTLTELRRRGALQPPTLPLPFSKKKLTTLFKEEATCVKDIRGANPHQLTCP